MGLSTGLFQQLKYLPALLPDGLYLPSLAAGVANQALFSYTGLATLGRVARLRDLRTLAQPGVTVQVTADDYASSPIDTGALGLVPAPLGLATAPWQVGAGQKLVATAANLTSGAVSNWWARWAVEVDLPNLADPQVLPGVPKPPANPATADAQALLQDPVQALQAPRPLGALIEAEYRPQIRDAVVLGQTLTLQPGTPALFIQEAVLNPQEILVWAGVAVSPGTGSDQLTLVVGVDDNDQFYTTLAYPLGQAGGWVPVFLQAQKVLKFSLVSQTAETVSLAVGVWHVRLTDAIRYRLGQGVAPAVAAQIEAGLL